MYAPWKAFAVSALVLLVTPPTAGNGVGDNKAAPKYRVASGEGTPVLWRDPGDIARRNTYYGPGGKAHEPQGPFTFEKEALDGTCPKFDVIDKDGVRWRVKLGVEAQPETAASRLVWVVGYFANEDYFMPVLHVQKMQHLHRGGKQVSADGTVHNVRLKRHLKGENKIGLWSWANNPFKGTREWYGLQALMAVISNWDLKDDNNSVYQVRGDSPEQRYVVSDLGATFGTNGLNWDGTRNLKAYSHSKWLGSVSDEFVDFNVPSAPAPPYFFNVPHAMRRLSLLWIGRKVPRADVKWMAHLLAQLSPEQIRDVFRAAGYSPAQVEGFSQALTRRIQVLDQL
jgi:hypothetical protein